MSACGSHFMDLAGLAVALRPSGALWIEAERMLVVADLHLEKGSAFAARGQLLPPYDTRETLRRLAAEAAATGAKTIILLGDTLHDRKAQDRMAQEDAQAIAALARAHTLVWVIGNHDEDGPGRLPGETADEIALGALILRHEPRVGADHAWVAGHLHPCVRVVGRGASTRRRCFVTDGARMVLPAFGAYAGGLNVRDAAFGGLFTGTPLAVALGRRAYPAPWSRLAGD